MSVEFKNSAPTAPLRSLYINISTSSCPSVFPSYTLRNVYKQRFLRLVDILKKLSNATSLSPDPKQQDLIH